MAGISKSRVSELCEELDEEVERFRGRPLEGLYPYVWLDATYLKCRQDGHVAATAVVIAVGVKAQDGREGGFRSRCGAQRGWGLLELVFALFGRPWALWGAVSNQRRSPGFEERY